MYLQSMLFLPYVFTETREENGNDGILSENFENQRLIFRPVSSYTCPNISILSRDPFPLSKNRCCTVCRIFHIACPFQQNFLFFRCCQKSFRVSYLCRSHGTDVYKVNICIFRLLTYAYVNTACNFLMFTPQ
jgi:hypothetical protein